MKIADNHCHISKEYFEDPLQEIKNFENGTDLEYIAVMGVDYNNDEEYLGYKKELNSDFLRVGMGFHPSEIIACGEKSLEEFERIQKLIEDNRNFVDFIGEIGIDFTYPEAAKFRNEQITIFKNFLQLGKELEKPVSIHCREAWDEITESITEVEFDPEKFNGFIHCFTGDFEQGMFFIENGFKLGLNGIITFNKSQELRDVIKELISFYSDKSFDDLFGLETDTPHLTPEPIRREKNSPRNIRLINDFVSKIAN